MGGTGNDTLIGGQGHDTLVGGVGNQLLVAGQGKDLLVGGIGDDTMVSGHGNDTMVAGIGHDTFVFSGGGGRDVVMDFHEGDILQIQRNINGLHVTSPADLAHLVHSDSAGNAVIDLGHGDTITLVDVKAQEVHADPSAFIKIH